MALLTAQLPTSNVNGAVYIGRGNALEVTLLEDGAAFDVATYVTRAIVTIGSYSIDSNTYADAFSFSAGGGKLSVELGSFPLSGGLQPMRLVIYDSSGNGHASGRVWIDGAPVYVVSEDTAEDLAAYGSVVLKSDDGTQYLFAVDDNGVPYTVALPNAAATAVSYVVLQSANGTAYKLSVDNNGIPGVEAA